MATTLAVVCLRRTEYDRSGFCLVFATDHVVRRVPRSRLDIINASNEYIRAVRDNLCLDIVFVNIFNVFATYFLHEP